MKKAFHTHVNASNATCSSDQQSNNFFLEAPLTYRRVWNKGFVVEAKNLSNIVEIRMLNHKRPLRVVHPIIEVCYRHLCSPIVFVVLLYVPMNPHGTHMSSALKQW